MVAITRSLRSAFLFGMTFLLAGLSWAQKVAEEPLRMTVVQTTQTSGSPLFEVRMHNAGDKDFILNLGMMLGNGSRQYPDAVHLRLTDEHGKTLLLDLIGPAIIAGRVDPLIVPLPKGATFSLSVDLKDYSSPKAKVWKLDLARGRYTLSAEYEGVAISQRQANIDTQGLALMPYWTGGAESKALQFQVAGKQHE
jgi:hypothetical protein